MRTRYQSARWISSKATSHSSAVAGAQHVDVALGDLVVAAPRLGGQPAHAGQALGGVDLGVQVVEVVVEGFGVEQPRPAVGGRRGEPACGPQAPHALDPWLAWTLMVLHRPPGSRTLAPWPERRRGYAAADERASGARCGVDWPRSPPSCSDSGWSWCWWRWSSPTGSRCSSSWSRPRWSPPASTRFLATASPRRHAWAATALVGVVGLVVAVVLVRVRPTRRAGRRRGARWPSLGLVGVYAQRGYVRAAAAPRGGGHPPPAAARAGRCCSSTRSRAAARWASSTWWPRPDRRGVETVVLGPDDDLTALAERAVTDGAEVLGMAGGDGSQADVAAVAVAHGLPFVCIPAGTRNHFALDLNLDRSDPRPGAGRVRRGHRAPGRPRPGRRPLLREQRQPRRVPLHRAGPVLSRRPAEGDHGSAAGAPRPRAHAGRPALHLTPAASATRPRRWCWCPTTRTAAASRSTAPGGGCRSTAACSACSWWPRPIRPVWPRPCATSPSGGHRRHRRARPVERRPRCGWSRTDRTILAGVDGEAMELPAPLDIRVVPRGLRGHRAGGHPRAAGAHRAAAVDPGLGRPAGPGRRGGHRAVRRRPSSAGACAGSRQPSWLGCDELVHQRLDHGPDGRGGGGLDGLHRAERIGVVGPALQGDEHRAGRTTLEAHHRLEDAELAVEVGDVADPAGRLEQGGERLVGRRGDGDGVPVGRRPRAARPPGRRASPAPGGAGSAGAGGGVGSGTRVTSGALSRARSTA